MSELTYDSFRNPVTDHLPAIALAAAAATALVSPGQLLRANRLSTEARYEVRHNDQDRAFIVVLGCRTALDPVIPMFEHAFADVADTAYIANPLRRFDATSVGKAMIEARKQLGRHKPLSVLLLSMAGLTYAENVDDVVFREAFGPVESICIDSGPSCWRDVKPNMRFAANGARALQYSRPGDWLSKKWVKKHASDHLDQHDPDITDEEVLAHRLSAANVCLKTTASHALSIKGGRRDKLRGAAERIDYLRAPDHTDNIVDTKRAFEGFYEALDGNITDIADPNRSNGPSHAASIEHPHFAARVMLGKVPKTV